VTSCDNGRKRNCSTHLALGSDSAEFSPIAWAASTRRCKPFPMWGFWCRNLIRRLWSLTPFPTKPCAPFNAATAGCAMVKSRFIAAVNLPLLKFVQVAPSKI
jgi:hypothetical protein